jgi:hypothetical protein
MDNYEEYVLRVFRRTHADLLDSLIPVHAGKLGKLLERFESLQSIRQEIHHLKGVTGFFKCACTMEWLMNRTKQMEGKLSAEQFESDILFLNEKLFEAFLNQPFDMPDYSLKETDDVPHRPVQKDLQVTADEFMYIEDTTPVMQNATPTLSNQNTHPAEKSLKDKEFDEIISGAMSGSYESHMMTSTPSPMRGNGNSPALAEAMNAELLDMTKTVAKQGQEFFEKKPTERVVAAAVMRVSAKTALESSRKTDNVIVQDFFQSLVSLISFYDKEGKIKSDSFAEAIRDIGDRLNIALTETSNGINLLKNLTEYISDPKTLLSKR